MLFILNFVSYVYIGGKNFKLYVLGKSLHLLNLGSVIIGMVISTSQGHEVDWVVTIITVMAIRLIVEHKGGTLGKQHGGIHKNCTYMYPLTQKCILCVQRVHCTPMFITQD